MIGDKYLKCISFRSAVLLHCAALLCGSDALAAPAHGNDALAFSLQWPWSWSWPNSRRPKAPEATTDAARPTGLASVAGLGQAKEEVAEIIDVLRDPQRYTRLGASIPRGLLLSGPPGTGKTLLARALAEEAKVPFLVVTASSWRDKWLGEGAKMVRKDFHLAKQHAPCILFIDEIDAIGGHRLPSEQGASSAEVGATLNELLVQLDGIIPTEQVFVIAATNMVERLDAALVRPGRFDRHVVLELPDEAARLAILQLHAGDKKCAHDVDLADIAHRSAGLSGAGLKALCNEAATLAVRAQRDAIVQADFMQALLRVRFGVRGASETTTQATRQRIAVHEVGHALLIELCPGTREVQEVTLAPTAKDVLGATLLTPRADGSPLVTAIDVKNDLISILGGRAAEYVVYGEVSAGAQSDLEAATQLAYSMVTAWGLEPSVAAISYARLQQCSHGSPSPELQGRIEQAVAALVDEAYEQAVELLTARRERLGRTAEALVERGSLQRADILQALSAG